MLNFKVKLWKNFAKREINDTVHLNWITYEIVKALRKLWQLSVSTVIYNLLD